MSATKWDPWLKASGLILWVGLMGVFAWSAMTSGWFDPERINALLKTMGVFAPLVFIGLMALAVISTFLPTLVLDIAAGVVFGPVAGTLYAVIGAELGAILAFLISRKLGREAMTHIFKKDIDFCDRCARRQLPYIIFFSRLLPVFNFDLVSYGAGLTAIPLRSYALATLLGMIPPTFLLVAYGESVVATLPPILTVFFSLVMIVLFFLVPVWIKHKNPFGLYDKMKGSQ